ncbi:MAG: hypothetical protein IPO41_04145 [Acidobacteria bacterium]|nr:hypothetical protein [Acidobacteriota bacterium]MBK9527510.1 hypothetical protein [Acidobacteriota bacterium]MBP7474765.1 hypothetical protein [Pyrinomonadaceae bacterium]MBP9108872.1 hypothetical protein [Pyrinomonadaceae bacterium]
MSKKMMPQVLALAMILLLCGSDLFAQTRISFRRGSTSASVSGNLVPGKVRYFVLTARSGQKLNAKISSGNGSVSFSDYSGDGGGVTSFQYVAENGDNELVIVNSGKKATNFTLTVSIR